MELCKKYLFVCLSLFIITVSAQNKVDSLLVALRNESVDTNKVNILVALCKEKIKNKPNDPFILDQLDEAMKLSVEKKYHKGLAEAWTARGNYFFYNFNYTMAVTMYETALTEYVKTKNRVKQAQSFFNIGTCYLRLTTYDKALAYNLRALKIYEELKNDFWEYSLLNNIGGIYYNQSNYKKALTYFLKALEVIKRSANKEETASELNNIGQLYTMINEYKTATDFFRQALEVNKETNDKYTYAQILGNMGSMHLKKNEYTKGIEYLEEARNLNEKLNDKINLSNNLTNIAEAYDKQNNFSQTIKYLEEALDIEKQTGDKEQLKLTYNQLEKTYFKYKKYDMAYAYLKKYSDLQDTLFNSESAKQVAAMEIKYQTEKKEKENELLNKQIEIATIKSRDQKVYLIVTATVLILLGFFAFNLYKQNKQKQKTNLQLAEKNQIIQKQKILVDKAFEELAEKNKEVLDSIRYAKGIQTALLTSEKYIEKALKRLKG
jgi:tetratricopeptide (TPR) repeat protein